MVKTPKMRHSTTRREPLTIELGANAVSRDDAAAKTDPAAAIVSESEDVSPAAQPADTKSPPAPPAEPIAPATEAGAIASKSEPADKPAGAASASASASPSGFGRDPYKPSATPPKPTIAAADKAKSTLAPTAAKGSDGFSRIGAGIIGAVVALAIAGGLQYAGVLGVPASGVGGGVSRAEFDAVKQQVAALEQGAGSGAASRVDALAADIEAIKNQIAVLDAPAADGTPAADPATIEALTARVQAVETALSGATQAAPASQPADLTPVNDRIAALEASVKAAGEARAAGDARFAALEQAVAGLTAKVDAQAAQPKIALAISTAALKSAIERGAPFMAELETFAAIAPNAIEIQALRAHAENGVPTRDALIAETDAAAGAMISAATPVDPNAGFFDRLLSSAESLVTVRPIGAIEGTSVAAIVARMEVALKAGDLAAAIAEFDSLPEPVKSAAGPFGERLKARQAVEQLVDQAIAAAMKA